VVVIARGQPKECKKGREREMARKGKRERGENEAPKDPV
jgi:hypothetical protein